MSKTKIMSFELLIDKETTSTEFRYVSLANCDLRNSVTLSFNSFKHYKQFFPLCQKSDFCDMFPFRSRAFN
jgi:hypothetical protein